MRVEDILKEFKLDLLSMDSEKIFKKYFFDSPSYLFEHVLKKPSLEDKIKRWISDATDVPASNIFLMGSSKLGFSISPTKKFSPIDAKFRHTNKTNDKSDLDVAIVSSELFSRIGREVYGLTNSYKIKWDENEYYNAERYQIQLCYKFFEYYTKGWYRTDFRPRGYDYCLNPWSTETLKREVYKIVRRKLSIAIYSEEFYFKQYTIENITSLSLKAYREII